MNTKIAKMFKHPGFVNIDYLVENKLETNPSKILNILNRDWRKRVKPLSMFNGGGLDPTDTFQAFDGGRVFGDVWNTGADYTTVHNAAAGSGSNSTNAGARTVGQYLDEGVYKIWRTGIAFITSGIQSATITAAKLRLCGEVGSDFSDTDFMIRIQKWTEGPGFNIYDYDAFDGINYDDGAFSTAAWVEGAYNDITITNFAIINKTGDTQIMVRSSRDIDSTTPIGYEMTGIQDDPNMPLLEVTYNLPLSKPKGTIAIHAKLAGII